MIRLDVTVGDIDQIIGAGYTLIRVYTDTDEDGEFTTLDGTITLVDDTAGYSYTDTDGTTSTWYKTAYYGSTPGESSKSDAQQGGTCDAYCTALDVRKELAVGSGASDISEKWEDVIWNMTVQSSRLIDVYKHVEENAYLASGSATRYVDGNGAEWLWLPWPAVSISAVSVEEADGAYTSWTQGTDYYRWPYQDSGGPANDPILRLDVNAKSDGGKSNWTRGQRRIKVTGVWGVATSPPDLIVRACAIQVANWYKLAMQGWTDTGGAPEFGTLEIPRKLDSAVMRLAEMAPPRWAGICPVSDVP